MNGFWTIWRRELQALGSSPMAYLFLALFVMMNGIMTFILGDFFDQGQADLRGMFAVMPFLFLFFVPALGMRSWAEERQTGSVELLLTLPISPEAAVLGKFCAGLSLAWLGLILTLPAWITVTWLGQPDHGLILSGYLAAFLLSASMMAITTTISALNRSQVLAFIISATCCFLFLVTGLGAVSEFLGANLPSQLALALWEYSSLARYNRLVEGLISLPDLFYFLLLIIVWLWASMICVRRWLEE